MRENRRPFHSIFPGILPEISGRFTERNCRPWETKMFDISLPCDQVSVGDFSFLCDSGWAPKMKSGQGGDVERTDYGSTPERGWQDCGARRRGGS